MSKHTIERVSSISLDYVVFGDAPRIERLAPGEWDTLWSRTA